MWFLVLAILDSDVAKKGLYSSLTWSLDRNFMSHKKTQVNSVNWSLDAKRQKVPFSKKWNSVITLWSCEREKLPNFLSMLTSTVKLCKKVAPFYTTNIAEKSINWNLNVMNYFWLMKSGKLWIYSIRFDVNSIYQKFQWKLRKEGNKGEKKFKWSKMVWNTLKLSKLT